MLTLKGKKQLNNQKGEWKKVSELKIGQKIAVLARPSAEISAEICVPIGTPLNAEKAQSLGNSGIGMDILWDEVVAINPVGREQVYDIEVEETHNFVGNDIFAHNTYINMSGNVGIGNTAPTAKLYVNDSEETSFVVTSEGRVGIGTTTPSYKLSVAGDIAATAFVNISTRNSKIDIQYLSGEEEKNILEKIKSANVATYHYSIENPANPKRLGLIAEEAPAEVLSIDGKGVDIYKLSTFILAGVKAQQMQIEDLKTRISHLESQNPQLASQTPTLSWAVSYELSTITKVTKNYLASLVNTAYTALNSVLADDSKLKVDSQDSENISYKTYGLETSRQEISITGTGKLVFDSNLNIVSARIKFDESFASVISTADPIRVIITPASSINGLIYIYDKSQFGFEVREKMAQDVDGIFDWMVVARKKGGEEVQSNASVPSAPAVEPAQPSAPSEPIITPPTEPVVTPSEPVIPVEPAIPPVESVAPATTTESVITEPAPVVTEPVPTETPPPAEEPAQ